MGKVRKIIKEHLKKSVIPGAIVKKCHFCGIYLVCQEFWLGKPTKETPYQIIKANNQYHISFEIGICTSCHMKDPTIHDNLRLKMLGKYSKNCFCHDFKKDGDQKKCSKCKNQLDCIYFMTDDQYCLCQKCFKNAQICQYPCHVFGDFVYL